MALEMPIMTFECYVCFGYSVAWWNGVAKITENVITLTMMRDGVAHAIHSN